MFLLGQNVGGSITYWGGARYWRSRVSHQWLISRPARSFGRLTLQTYSPQLICTFSLGFGKLNTIRRPLA